MAHVYTYSLAPPKSAGQIATIEHKGAISLRFRIGLDLMLTSSAPDDDLHTGRRSVAERRWRAAVGFHQRHLRRALKAKRARAAAGLRTSAAHARWEEIELGDVGPVIER